MSNSAVIVSSTMTQLPAGSGNVSSWFCSYPRPHNPARVPADPTQRPMSARNRHTSPLHRPAAMAEGLFARKHTPFGRALSWTTLCSLYVPLASGDLSTGIGGKAPHPTTMSRPAPNFHDRSVVRAVTPPPPAGSRVVRSRVAGRSHRPKSGARHGIDAAS